MGLLDDAGVAQFMPSFSGIFGGDLLIMVLWGVIILALVGIMVLLVYRHWQFKYRVILNEPRGQTLLRGVTEARKIEEKDGSKRWYIKSLKKKVAIPNLEVMNPSMEKRLREGVIELLRIDEETFIAVNVAYEIDKAKKEYDVKIVPLANNLKDLRTLDNDMRRDYDAQNWLKANAAMLVQMAGLMLIIGAVIFIVIMLQDSVNASNGAVQAAAGVNERLMESLERLNACKVGGIS